MAAPSTTNNIEAILENLENVKNIRDLSSAAPGKIAPGRFFRSGNPAHSSPNDTQILRNRLNINTFLDFRSKIEHMEDKGWHLVLSNGKITTYDVKGTFTAAEFEETLGLDLPCARLYRLPLIEKRRLVKSVLWRLTFSKAAQLLFYKLLNNEDKMRAIIVPEINQGGLPLVYQIIMESASQEIAHALRVILQAAAQQKPQMIFCKLGKDRTGLIAALVLACCDATNDEIVSDYIKSNKVDKVALGGIERMKDVQGVDSSIFSTATREAMMKTLENAQHKYGGLKGYMKHIGFTDEMQGQLKRALSPETPWQT